ncbi:MAG: aldehyde dehydrogenase family protein [Neisseriaceae bacterium]
MSEFQLNREEVKQIVSHLRATFDEGKTKTFEWRKQQLIALRNLLDDNSAKLSRALYQDLGKAPSESAVTEISFVRGEINYALRRLKRWMRPQHRIMPLLLQPAAGKLVYEPLGVVLIIAPWNYPMMLLLAPLVGALAAGNVALLKPSELAPTVAKTLVELIPKYLDHGAVKIVEGGPEETGFILEERFDHIFYTGNENVARIVSAAAAKHLTPVTLELGGKCPAWVGNNTQLKKVANRLVWAKFLNAGQTCVAPDYVLTTPEVADKLTEHLVSALKRFYGKHPERSASYCRIISRRHVDRLKELLDDLEPRQLIVGGEIDEEKKYIAPTVVAHVDLESRLMGSEIFGPILPIIRVDNFEEALSVIQKGEKPLALYAFTTDSTEKKRLIEETSSGAVGMNVAVAHLSAPNLPFGGVGASGQGHYGGRYSFVTFSHLKPVLSKPLWPDTLRFIYAPYGLLVKWVAKLLIGR